MLKVNQKKKRPQTAITKPKTTEKPQQPKPEWNSLQNDPDRYKLSQAEIIQRKVAMMSKHKFEAKELWQKRQEKLQKGIIDEETRSVFETCLMTKRPPEKNYKNITYFIRNENESRQQLHSQETRELSPDDELSLSDLKNEVSQVVQRRPSTAKPKGEDKDLMKKIEDSLKDTRDFIKKIDRYPSVTKSRNPEKALKVFESLEKEKASSKLNSARESRNNLSSKKGKDTSYELEKSMKASTTELETKNTTFNITKTEDPDISKVSKKMAFTATDDKDDDISRYFTSLNKIEDTIKFLEENIIGSNPVDKVDLEFEKFTSNIGKSEPAKDFQFNPERSVNLTRDEYANILTEPSPRGLHNRKPSTDKNQVSKAHQSFDDEQISFTLTMRSTVVEPHEEVDNNKYSDLLFASTTLDKKKLPEPKPQNDEINIVGDDQPELPRTFAHPKPTAVETLHPYPEPQKEKDIFEDDDDLNIENIKMLLQATKADIDRMNTSNAAISQSFISNTTAFKDTLFESKMTLPTQQKENIPQDMFSSPQPMPKPNVTKQLDIQNNLVAPKTEVSINVRQPLNVVLENQRKILNEITNHKIPDDDEIPIPRSFNLKKQKAYSPKRSEDNSLSIRSFIKK